MSAATKPTPARILVKVLTPDSSGSSSTVASVALVVPAAATGERGLVGGLRATVALGRATVAEPAPLPPGSGAFAVLRAMVGAPMGARDVASLMVGAGAGALGVVGAPTAGAEAVGGPDATLGGTGGDGALTAAGGGVGGRVAEGTAGGESAALRVTRTVSFFKGTLVVCLDETLEVCLDGTMFSLSLMLFGFIAAGHTNAIRRPRVKLASLKKNGRSRVRLRRGFALPSRRVRRGLR